MTYFRTGTPYYHRRAAVSRSCSGWEGVGPAGYGRQALTGIRGQESGIRKVTALARVVGSDRCLRHSDGKVREIGFELHRGAVLSESVQRII